MYALTAVIVGLVDTLVEFATVKIAAIANFQKMLPTDIVQIIDENKGQLALLPLAVMVPGGFCILFLLLGAICPNLKMHKGSYCLSKCFIMLANLFLLLSLIFYIIFVAIAVILKFAPPAVQEQINQILGMCDTIPLTFNQMLADISPIVSTLKTAGQDVVELESNLKDIGIILGLLDKGCGHLQNLFPAIYGLFLPGLTCVVAIVFAFFVNNTLCCVTGCCRAPPSTPVVTKSDGGTEMIAKSSGTVQEV